jgi:hypothetical protein
MRIRSLFIDFSNNLGSNVLDLRMQNLPQFADNALALAGGLVVGQVYRNVDLLQVVH